MGAFRALPFRLRPSPVISPLLRASIQDAQRMTLKGVKWYIRELVVLAKNKTNTHNTHTHTAFIVTTQGWCICMVSIFVGFSVNLVSQ